MTPPPATRPLKPTTREVCTWYFKAHPSKANKWMYECKKSRTCDVKKHEYTNLIHYIRQLHPNFDAEYAEAHQLRRGSSLTPSLTLDHYFDSKSSNIFKWIDWVVMDALELDFVEKERTERNTNLKPVSVKTLKKYCFGLVQAVEVNIARAFQDRPFALVFDCWSEDSTHFMGLFVSYSGTRDSDSLEFALLSFSPLQDQASFAADIQARFIQDTLKWYKLSDADIQVALVCLIGDNCSMNKRTANLMDLRLLGCRSHRFNRGIVEYLATHLSVHLTKVSGIMTKLKSLKPAGRLRLSTSLKPVKRNKHDGPTLWTRWHDTFVSVTDIT